MSKLGVTWDLDEIEMIVADYLAMLRLELSGSKFSKIERNRALQEQIGRTKGSIEYKHQNISAVMERLGLPFVLGYKPARNYQTKLFETIEKQLIHGELAERLANETSIGGIPYEGLEFQKAPNLEPEKEPKDRTIRRIIRHFDPAKRDAMARELGKAGEKFLYQAEQNRLSSLGRDDLAGRVRWVSKEDGDGTGYDILSYSANGRKRLLEVKTTNGPITTPFWISRNELNVANENPDTFRVARLYHFSRSPEAYKLRPPLTNHIHLNATEYLASFR